MSRIAELTAKLSLNKGGFESGLRSAAVDLKKFGSDAKGIGGSLRQFGSSLSGFGSQITKGLTVPLLAVGGTAVAASLQVDQAMATIRTGTGATGAALDGLQKDFTAVFRSVPNSAAEAATAIADLNTRLGLTGDPLRQLSIQVLNLARITGEQVQPLIQSTSRVMGDWGVSAEKTGDTMDYLFKVSQTTGIGVNQLAGRLVQFGAPLRQMGFSFSEAAVMMGKFEKEGVNTELVLGSMRQALTNFSREGVTDTKSALLDLMEKIRSVGSAGEATAIAMKYFGAEAGPDMAAAIREGRFEFAELLDVVGSSSETINRSAEDALTLTDRLRQLKNEATAAAAPVGEVLVSGLERLTRDGLIPAARFAGDLAQQFKELPDYAKGATVGIAGLLAVIGPASVGLGFMAGQIGNLIKAWPLLVAGAAAAGAKLLGVAQAIATGLTPAALAGTTAGVGALAAGLTAVSIAALGAAAGIYRVVSGMTALYAARDAQRRAVESEIGALRILEGRLRAHGQDIGDLRRDYRQGIISIDEYRAKLIQLAKTLGDAKVDNKLEGAFTTLGVKSSSNVQADAQAAREAFTIIEKAYQEGMATAEDLQKAQLALQRALQGVKAEASQTSGAVDRLKQAYQELGFESARELEAGQKRAVENLRVIEEAYKRGRASAEDLAQAQRLVYQAAERTLGPVVSLRQAIEDLNQRAADRKASEEFVSAWVQGLDEVHAGKRRLIEPPNLEDFGRQALSVEQYVESLSQSLQRAAENAGEIQFGQQIRDAKELAEALSRLGVQKGPNLEQMKKDLEVVLKQGSANERNDAQIKVLEARKRAGEVLSKSEEEQLAKLKKSTQDTGKVVESVWSEVGRRMEQVFQQVSKSIGDLLWEGGKFSDRMKKILTEFAKGLTQLGLERLFKSMGTGLAKLGSQLPGLGSLGKILSGSKSAAPAAANTAVNSTGGLNAALGTATSGLMGTLGAIGSLGTMVSSIFGNFQTAKTNKLLGETTRGIIGLVGNSTGLNEQMNRYLPALQGIHERLMEIRNLGVRVFTTDSPLEVVGAGISGGGGTTINMAGASFIGFRDLDAFLDELARRLRQRGV
jgi:TP901 family phage tail tape measure protein